MRVAIQYTIEFDDIPQEVSKLLNEIALPQPSQLNIIVDTVESKNMLKSLEDIQELRSKLGKIDHRLSDCASIIRGYINAVNKEEADETV